MEERASLSDSIHLINTLLPHFLSFSLLFFPLRGTDSGNVHN